jgi:hypothetical protein
VLLLLLLLPPVLLAPQGLPYLHLLLSGLLSRLQEQQQLRCGLPPKQQPHRLKPGTLEE